MTRVDSLQLVGINGTNRIMAGELSRLVARATTDVRLGPRRSAGPGAVIYPFDPRVADIAAHYHRTCSRLLWNLYQSRARRLEPLYSELADDVRADDRSWMWDGAGISVLAKNVGGFAAGERQVVGTVKNAVIEGAASRKIALHLAPEDPDIQLVVRLHDDALTVSVDLVGRPMHKRGYRQVAGEAPLRENLAAALLMLARYDPRSDLLFDPMTGSGTIAIEAALMARGAALWPRKQPPALRRLPPWQNLAPLSRPLFADTQPQILAVDIDRNVLGYARKNAARAGVADQVRLSEVDCFQLTASAVCDALGAQERPGLIVANPPYGVRMSGDELALYRRMGPWLRQFSGWRAAFLVANRDFEAALGLRPRIVKPIRNAPQKAIFYLFDL